MNLEDKAKQIRKELVEMCIKASAGHVASSLSCVDILVSLYYGGMLRFDSKNSTWEGRDIFIFSKGHAVDALYPILADLGYFDKAELNNFCNGKFGLHPDSEVSGIEMITGSLGHGLGVAAGIALAYKIDNKPNSVYVLMGDGECQEGSVWEAAMFAGHHKLNNLTAIIDCNSITTIDFIRNYLTLDPICDKWNSFGWGAYVCDGHSFEQLHDVFTMPKIRGPKVIIAKTVKGKGIKSLENSPIGHTKIPILEELNEMET